MLWRILILGMASAVFVIGCSSGAKKDGADDNPIYQVESLNSNYEYHSVNDQIFIGPQPSPENIKEFKSDKGVAVIINLRATKENKKVSFDPEKIAQSVNVKYYQVPLMKGGNPSEAALDRIAAIMKKHGRVKYLIYDSAGNRAAAWYATYSAQQREMTTDDAVASAAKVGLSNKRLKSILASYLKEKNITVDKAATEPAPSMAKVADDNNELAPESDEAMDPAAAVEPTEGLDSTTEEPIEGLGGEDSPAMEDDGASEEPFAE